jgi:hypothetical protein
MLKRQIWHSPSYGDAGVSGVVPRQTCARLILHTLGGFLPTGRKLPGKGTCSLYTLFPQQGENLHAIPVTVLRLDVSSSLVAPPVERSGETGSHMSYATWTLGPGCAGHVAQLLPRVEVAPLACKSCRRYPVRPSRLLAVVLRARGAIQRDVGLEPPLQECRDLLATTRTEQDVLVLC